MKSPNFQKAIYTDTSAPHSPFCKCDACLLELGRKYRQWLDQDFAERALRTGPGVDTKVLNELRKARKVLRAIALLLELGEPDKTVIE